MLSLSSYSEFIFDNLFFITWIRLKLCNQFNDHLNTYLSARLSPSVTASFLAFSMDRAFDFIPSLTPYPMSSWNTPSLSGEEKNNCFYIFTLTCQVINMINGFLNDFSWFINFSMLLFKYFYGYCNAKSL